MTKRMSMIALLKTQRDKTMTSAISKEYTQVIAEENFSVFVSDKHLIVQTKKRYLMPRDCAMVSDSPETSSIVITLHNSQSMLIGFKTPQETERAFWVIASHLI